MRRSGRNSWRLQPVEWSCIQGPFTGWLTYQLFTGLLLHSFCDIKGTKWFSLFCLPRSDLTVQAVVELIQQVHLTVVNNHCSLSQCIVSLISKKQMPCNLSMNTIILFGPEVSWKLCMTQEHDREHPGERWQYSLCFPILLKTHYYF